MFAMDVKTCFACSCTNIDRQRPTRSAVHVCVAPTNSVHHLVRTFQYSKRSSTGFNEILFWVFQRNAHKLAEIVTYFFNFLLKIVQYPSAMKTAKPVTLSIIKSPKTAGDFRRVTVTSSLVKVFKKLSFSCFIRPKFSNYLKENQLGLRETLLTFNALIALQNY